ncbi:MAG: phage major capsid protein, P2 family [Betaproteobacteria bacterium]|nr:phage major capsid protein, P2 family [Betaproteobacteria bacterium]
MKNTTRQKCSAIIEHLAKLNGVSSAAQSFAVEPTIQQKLEDQIQEEAVFLKSVNLFIVDELKGAKVALGVNRPIASNTNTQTPGKTRQTRDVSNLSGSEYECRKNNFDTRIPYALLDQWAKFPDFAVRLRNHIVAQQARDIQTIAFNGTKYAEDSNPVTNPLLQDVNIGWLQKMRDAGAEHYVDSVKVGAAQEIKNVDALVMDALNSLIAPWYRKAPGMVIICSEQFLLRKYYGLINVVQAPTEQVAASVIASTKEIGGLTPVTPPFFPDDTFLITSLKNLSRYTQAGGRRRYMKESPEIDAIENFESSNDAYEVEDYDGAVLVENIQFV